MTFVLRRGSRRLAVALALAASASGTRGLEPPPLDIRSPPELAVVARELIALGPEALAPPLELTGAPAGGPPIVVVLLAADAPEARALPPWISGYARGGDGVIVLVPSRVHRYPGQGLLPLLRHEVSHVLAARAAGGAAVPRWFDEGLAMAAGREWALGDRARVTLAVLRDDTLPIERLDRAFAGGETAVESAYALAGDLVRELLARHGADTGARILAELARGRPFPTAFRAVAGVGLGDFEREYWRRRTLLDRWIPILSSSTLLWAGAAFLVVAAWRRKRARSEERMLAYEREEDGPVE